MAKPELGIKRVCPVTGRKFYDLNRDPIVSPYTGQAYPRTFFEPQAKAEPADDDEDEVAEGAPPVEMVALEEADGADGAAKETVADDIDEEIVAEDADDTFLEEEEEGDDDVSDLIDGDIADDEES